MVATVQERILELIKLFIQRNNEYGENYKRFGAMCVQLWPKGLHLRTEDDFNRFGVYVDLVSKISRYAAQFSEGGHADSLDDISVGAQMLSELDEEIDERAVAASEAQTTRDP